MFAKITKEGTFKILRGNRWLEQECPHKSEGDACYCGDWCPKFGEPEYNDLIEIGDSIERFEERLMHDTLSICNKIIYAHLADDRVNESFVLEPPIPDYDNEDDRVGYQGLSALDVLIPGLSDDEDDDEYEDVTERVAIMQDLAQKQIAPADLDEYIDAVLSGERVEDPDGLI